jgi:8-oxo-dGTP diphosphatase
MRLEQNWDSWFPDDVLRIREYVRLLRSGPVSG